MLVETIIIVAIAFLIWAGIVFLLFPVKLDND
jgi:hypothetical protein